jgi:hypothetical protein
MRKEKLTIEQHRQVAAHIHAIEKHVSDITHLLDDRVPAPVLDLFLGSKLIFKRLMRAKSALGDLLIKDHYPKGAAETSMYYGWFRVECATTIRPKDANE